MRELANAERIRSFMRAFGREAAMPGRVLFTGGATAVLLGWRESTIDVDIKLVPDQDALLRSIPALKESLHLNVELASPDDFIPVRDGWLDRSPFIGHEGRLTFQHFELVAQALAKIERGHAQDLADVRTCSSAAWYQPGRSSTSSAPSRDSSIAIRPSIPPPSRGPSTMW